MFPEFFAHKAREVMSFLHIMKGKITDDDEARKEGVEEALESLEKERDVYLKEKEEASRHVDSDRDISAI